MDIEGINEREARYRYSYSRYTRDQILVASGLKTFDRNYASREGVAFSSSVNTELLLVTLKKSEKDFSPTTMYEDYALSRELFHWQSQSTTGEDTPKGFSYIHHRERDINILLFVREQNKDEYGRTMSYVFLGPVQYVDHYGTKPMSITWKLEFLMPSWLWRESGKMAVG